MQALWGMRACVLSDEIGCLHGLAACLVSPHACRDMSCNVHACRHAGLPLRGEGTFLACLAQAAQEAHVRGAVATYFEREDSAPDQAASKSAEQQPGSALQGLPLAAKTGFLAKDARMLLRETSAKTVSCPTLSAARLASVARPGA